MYMCIVVYNILIIFNSNSNIFSTKDVVNLTFVCLQFFFCLQHYSEVGIKEQLVDFGDLNLNSGFLK